MSTFIVHFARFEGPLDVLLDIVQRNELPFADLPLAAITTQYLDYMAQAESLDMELGIEFIDMAARLIRWKSASLLPSDPTIRGPEPSLAEELAYQLTQLEQEQIARGKSYLEDRREENTKAFATSSLGDWQDSPAPNEDEDASLWTLRQKAQSLRDLFEQRRVRREDFLDFQDSTEVTVEEMTVWLNRWLMARPSEVWYPAESVFCAVETLQHRICLFLSLLELVRRGNLFIEQRGHKTYLLQPEDRISIDTTSMDTRSIDCR